MLCYGAISYVLISLINIRWGLCLGMVEEYATHATHFWYCTTARALRCGQCISDHCLVETKSNLQGLNLMHSDSNFLLIYFNIPILSNVEPIKINRQTICCHPPLNPPAIHLHYILL